MDTPGDLAELARAVEHRFRDEGLLAAAVTHPSMTGLERTGPAAATTYERLEFLGDRVLGLVVAHWLLERYPAEREGDLAKRHAGLVRREALSRVAQAIDLGRRLRLAPGEAEGGGRSNHTILADACEAVIGALYLDGGLEVASRFIRARWAPLLDDVGAPPLESKTALQEWAQARGLPLPVYETLSQSG
ncbi:MAG TPA: ribonuclease III, partial [Azospirillaceae bacterium]|nr:ribonuclease III [Azospirillaceae bacterium]